ncbi:MAG: hypothetical protein HQM08_26300 [Candidatus Riflebacteria bacterium]|nr:hypothetical protein [Candidatus Riflebacteria bacterium]
MKKAFTFSMVVTIFLAFGPLYGAEPVRNISPAFHSFLAAAQTYGVEAFNWLTRAQIANDWDLQGHAKNAKALLGQANDELKLAAEVSNENGANSKQPVSSAVGAGGQLQNQNVNKDSHPFLFYAQVRMAGAYTSIWEAQQANMYNLQGHAKNAKALLQQAMDELNLATQASDQGKPVSAAPSVDSAGGM